MANKVAVLSGSERAEKRIKPYVDSVNALAGRARGLWIAYLTFSLYLLIAVGSVTHRDLFLETPLQLPVLDVDLPLTAFFVVAPALFILNHFYLLLTLLSLGRRAEEFNSAMERVFRYGDMERDIRRKLDSFVVVLALAGTVEERKGWTGRLLMLIAVITIIVVPIVLLLVIQLTFLPYHEAWITWVHRFVLLGDLALLWVFWPAILNGSEHLRFPPIFRWYDPHFWRSWMPQNSPVMLLPRVVALPSLLVMVFSFLIATFPGESHDRNGVADLKFIPLSPEMAAKIEKSIVELEAESKQKGVHENQAGDGHPNAETSSESVSSDTSGCSMFYCDELHSVYQLLFLGEVDRVTGKRWSLWSNTLVLPHGDFVDDDIADATRKRIEEMGVDPWHVQRTRVLRGRNLRGAVLTRADLRYFDLTGAQLQEADLRSAELDGADLQEALLYRVKLQNTKFFGVDFLRAELREANLSGSILVDGTLEAAQLQYANLSRVTLRGTKSMGADFFGSNLREADLSFARLQGANFPEVDLRETILRGANLGQANLWRADFRGSDLRGVSMQVADLAQAELQRADLRGASLLGANLWGAQMEGTAFGCDEEINKCTNLNGAIVGGPDGDFLKPYWEALFPDEDIMERIGVLAPVKDEMPNLHVAAAGTELKAYLGTYTGLDGRDDDRRWLVDFLTGLACGDEEGFMARGVAHRVSRLMPFTDERVLVATNLTGATCEGRKFLSDATVMELKEAAALPLSNPKDEDQSSTE